LRAGGRLARNCASTVRKVRCSLGGALVGGLAGANCFGSDEEGDGDRAEVGFAREPVGEGDPSDSVAAGAEANDLVALLARGELAAPGGAADGVKAVDGEGPGDDAYARAGGGELDVEVEGAIGEGLVGEAEGGGAVADAELASSSEGLRARGGRRCVGAGEGEGEGEGEWGDAVHVREDISSATRVTTSGATLATARLGACASRGSRAGHRAPPPERGAPRRSRRCSPWRWR
jgi:hypothetical protein